MKKLFFITLLLFPLYFLSADALLIDQYNSPYCSSNNFITVENQLIRLQDKAKHPTAHSLQYEKFNDLWKIGENYSRCCGHNSLMKNIGLIFLRSFELGAIWVPINATLAVAHHEVNGHGYRLRSFGKDRCQVIGYSVLPKILDNNFAVMGLTKFNFLKPRTFAEDIAVSIAGLEANSIFAHNLIFSWLEKGYIDGRQASLWSSNQFAIVQYVGTVKDLTGSSIMLSGLNNPNDIQSYFYSLHCCYPGAKDFQSHLNQLRNRAIKTLVLNPFTYLSLLSECHYLFYNSKMPIFSFGYKGTRFLPLYKMGLSPFGLEDIVEFFAWGPSLSPTSLYGKYGAFAGHSYSGFGFENRGIFNSSLGSFGMQFDMWSQPELVYEEMVCSGIYKKDLRADWGPQTNKLGGAFSIIYRKISEKNSLTNIWVQLGGKTSGFLPGESLDAAPIIKIGASLNY